MVVTVIGTGLIGGSMALDLKKRRLATTVLGVDKNSIHLAKALEVGIIDEAKSLEEAVPSSDLIILSIPVDNAPEVLTAVLDNIKPGATVIDVGSIKQNICNAVANHKNRSQFVACHPIAGTEFSGPDAAHYYLFDGKVNIICDAEHSNASSLAAAEKVFESLKMKTIKMEAAEHDRHIAYVSHLSHITSFTLGLTVLDIEKDEKSIFNMAGSGFASTVRLANSSANMWAPIFHENKENLVTAIDAYVDKLNALKLMIQQDELHKTHEHIASANEIKRILDGIELKGQEAALNN
ncbi:prephenate dehydrogenase [Fulvivirga lutimaris]|uniref:prephenate dehydrogenase n=1 Tax=Fulvivirga lutimaris TaxID=1819566 RepID=UPI0012BBF74E|nr:prephenate dehydrogenase [Fulvivirga lutimaris]MTI39435.1 prephenate dehydrogenase [Fulvivirga lutimaris]